MVACRIIGFVIHGSFLTGIQIREVNPFSLIAICNHIPIAYLFPTVTWLEICFYLFSHDFLTDMTSILDPTTIGKPKRPRRHVRSLTSTSVSKCLVDIEHTEHDFISGYLPEEDDSGKEKWLRGEEKVWKDGYRKLDTGE